MIFTEAIFPFFLLFSFVTYWRAAEGEKRKRWLIVLSSMFYGWWDVRFLGLLYLTATFDYFMAQAIQAQPFRRKTWLIFSIFVNLGVLGTFKYYNFFAASAVELSSQLGLTLSPPVLNLILPFGISFYTFQSMSYVIDVYRGQLRPSSFADFLIYVMFFPQLVAGPIVRAGDFLPQLRAPAQLTQIDFRYAFYFILVGYFKKAVLGDNLAAVVDPIFANPGVYSSAACWFAAVGYYVQVYCDFSGYSDMAIGLAALFGFSLCENFRTPYLATNLQDFWRRWHISFSTWLRDYVYIPLGGSRRGTAIAYRNVLITLLLGGLWHGAAWNFIIWGGVNALGVILYSVWSRWNQRYLKVRLPLVAAWFATQAFVCGSDILFRLSQPGTFLPWLKRAASGVGGLEPRAFAAWWGFLVVLLVAHWGWQRTEPLVRWQRTAAPLSWFAVGFAIAAMLFFVPLKLTPFIYFQF